MYRNADARFFAKAPRGEILHFYLTNSKVRPEIPYSDGAPLVSHAPDLKRILAALAGVSTGPSGPSWACANSVRGLCPTSMSHANLWTHRVSPSPIGSCITLTCVRCLPPEFLLVARVTCVSVLPSVEAAVSPPGVASAPSSVGEKSDPNVNALSLTLNKSSRRFYFVSRCGIFFFHSKVHKILVDTLWKFSLELCMTTKKDQKKQKY